MPSNLKQRGRQPVNRQNPSSKKSHRSSGLDLAENGPPGHELHVDIQQQLLNIYALAFHDLLVPSTTQEILEPKLQQIKQHLFTRDFNAAFGDVGALRAYSARWSPTRALAYAGIFLNIDCEHLLEYGERRLDCLCLGGGGGAEMVGLSALLLLSVQGNGQPSQGFEKILDKIDVTVVDIADWSAALHQLRDAFNKSGVSIDERVSYSCIKENLLQPGILSSDRFSKSVASADLVTICFTLNELFSDSLPKTQTLLLDLTSNMKKGALLVVVDSAGSYSTVGLGSNQNAIDDEPQTVVRASLKDDVRKYPMAWLLDHILLKLAPQLDTGRKSPWQKLRTEQSVWFRLSNQLLYPIKLEDMRYQLHFFQRV